MAFKHITGSKLFKIINSSLGGKTFIARGKRFTFIVLYCFVSDEAWQRIQYRIIFKKRINLREPKTFAERLVFLKLFYKNPLMHVCADKYHVNEYLRLLNLQELIIPELGVYSRAEDICFEHLPQRFIIKCTQGSGSNLIVDKSAPDYNEKRIVSYFKECLKMNYYKVGREYGYQGLTPLLLCQPVLQENGGTLTDYKFYCFDGKVLYYMVSFGEYSHEVKNHKFDRDNKSIDIHFKEKEQISPNDIHLPENIEQMILLAEQLAAPFPHVRVDLYNVDGKIYFGEMTFYSSGGFVKIADRKTDLEIGEKINLEKYKKAMVFPGRAQKYKNAR